VEPLTFPDRPYRGNALEYIDTWKKYMEKGVRRCICLQGKPGTGKSTLTRTAATLINKRTVKVTSTAFRRMHFAHWKTMIALLSPDLLILDDIDRIPDLEEYLDRFEDAYYTVPLTLFTSNDLDEVPEAFLRPGRIDQVLELDDPSPDVRLEVLQEFSLAEGAGVIPVWKIPFVEALYEKYTGAFAVEYLRRVAVEGWEYRLPKNDITFKELVGKEDEYDPRTNTDLDNELLKTLKTSSNSTEEVIEDLMETT
jgi:SpoVK/Ycf46/Vps4 family AAA+-type ATPase